MASSPVAILSLTAATLAALFAPASARQINTGDPIGAYHLDFCPLLSTQLRLAQFDYACTPSFGTRDSMERVIADPQQIGYGHLDVFALESRRTGADRALTIVRQDDVRACLFAVTRNKKLSNWGEIRARAAGLRFVLPPAAFDSAGTFHFLRAIDAEGLGRAKSIVFSVSIEDAIRDALSADDAVSFIVQVPDPDSAAFEMVRKLGGRLVAVMDRAILRQAVDDKKIFFPQAVEIESTSWIKSARKVVTACTPLVVFTGRPERVKEEAARKDHEDLVRTAAAIKPAALLPEASVLGQALRRTKEISASGSEWALELTEEARARAQPYADKAMEKAWEVGERASQAAKPYLDKVKETAQNAYEETVRFVKELLDKSRGEPGPKKD